jgi:hypothetical protein
MVKLMNTKTISRKLYLYINFLFAFSLVAGRIYDILALLLINGQILN